MSVISPNPSALKIGSAVLECANALDCYQHWPSPTAIISDGPYGLSRYPGDCSRPEQLPAFYEPHVRAWSEAASSRTTLWFWGSEISWAYTHPLLVACGWHYRSLHVWDKGLTVAADLRDRRFEVTEVCAQYVREIELPLVDGVLVPIRVWFREEWRRSGLPLRAANAACGVKDAASRKYLSTEAHNWYFPPQEIMDKLVAYANTHGEKTKAPYFYFEGAPMSHARWTAMRSVWNHVHGITNVWSEPRPEGLRARQKPRRLLELPIIASSNLEDIIWEPFGGLCETAFASTRLGRRSYTAEAVPKLYQLAVSRLQTQSDNALR